MATVSGGEVHLSPEQFDALYARDEVSELSLDLPVWEMRGPREAVVRWQKSAAFRGNVLDAGCGAGFNALWLAEQGHHVTGFDLSPNALRIARARAEGGPPVRFVTANAVDLTLPDTYDTVLDSTLYHCLVRADRRTYLQQLGRVCRPGARLLMICVSDALPASLPGPARITRDELREVLPATGWDLVEVTPGFITLNYTLELLRTVCESIELPEPRGDEVPFDNGLARFPTWEVVAQRSR